MSTVLVFVIIPAAVIGLVATLVIGGARRGGGRADRRYRPGRPYGFQPIWFLARPEKLATAATGHALETAQKPALASGYVESSTGERVPPGPTGGASDRW